MLTRLMCIGLVAILVLHLVEHAKPLTNPSPIEHRGKWFAFWMPKRELLIGAVPRTSAPDVFVVVVQALHRGSLDVFGYRPPEVGLRNIASYYVGRGDAIRLQDAYGLQRYWFDSDMFDYSEFYRHPEGTQPEVNLICFPLGVPLQNPSCSGEIRFTDGDLRFSVGFSRKYLPEWREILNAVRELEPSVPDMKPVKSSIK